MNLLEFPSPTGFPNLGNTCWLNSLVQVLIHNKLCSELFKRLPHNFRSNSLSNTLKNFFLQDFNPVHSLSSIINLFVEKIGNGVPQDSHEAVLWLIEELHSENKTKVDIDLNTVNELTKQLFRYNQGETSLIYNLFQGIMVYKTSDNETRYEPFITFFLELVPRTNSEPLNVTDCFELTFRKRQIVHMPGVLFVCFERTDGGEYNLTTSFELADPDDKVIKFRLSGVVLHYGSQFGGHYISFSNTQNGWLLFDDNNIRKINTDSSIVRGTPRLMIYERY